MKKNTLNIASVNIHKFLGCQPGISTLNIPEGTFSNGVNIIFGPNGSGKTTLAKAIQAMIWPCGEAHQQVWIEGKWQINNQEWKITLNQGKAFYFHQGEEASPPHFPEKQHQNRYYLALHELLIANDRELLKQIRDEIHGGIDLDKAKTDLGFDPKPPSAKVKEFAAIKQAEAVVRELTNRDAALLKEEKELEELAHREKELNEKDQRCRQLDQVISYRKVIAALTALETKLKEYHPLLHHFKGDEAEKWEEWEKLSDELTLQLRDKNDQLEHHLAIQKKTGLSSSLDTCTTHNLNEELKNLIELEIKIGSLKELCTELSKKEETLRQSIDNSISTEHLIAFESDQTGLLKEWQRLYTDYQSHQRVRSLLAQFYEGHAAPQSNIEDEIEKWTEWLSIPDPLINQNWIYLFGSLYLISLFSLLIYGFFYPTPIFIPIFLCLLLSGGWSVNTLWNHQTPLKRKKESPQWDRNQVVSHLQQLIAASQKEKFQQELHTFFTIQSQAQQQKIGECQERLTHYSQEALSHFPIRLDLTNPTLPLLVEKMSLWKKIHVDLQGAAAKLSEADINYAGIITRCNQLIAPFTDKKAKTKNELSGITTDLQKRSEQWNDSARNITFLQMQIKQDEAKNNLLKEKKETLLKSIMPLLAGETPLEIRNELYSLISLCKEYHKHKNECEHLKQQAEKLKECAHIDLATPLSQLEEELTHHQQVEKELLQTRETITAIRTKIMMAKGKNDLARALSLKEDAYEDLQKLFEKTCISFIGDKILKYAIEKSAKHASEVFTKAKTLFGTITKHQYELIIGEGEQADFKARNTLHNTILRLNELSSGTRIQLLLSVRVAFIETMEGAHPQMPLLLDEVLGNSDNERTEAIIDTVIALAKMGRQIIYFTAQSDEVSRWMRRLSETPGIAYHSPIQLPLKEETETYQWTLEKPLFEVPLPANLSYKEYGELLQVPPLGDESIEQMHLWHFFEDTGILYRLLQMGYKLWGQLENFSLQYGEECLQKLGVSKQTIFWIKAQAIAASFKKGKELLKQGKGKKLDEITLTNSGCISQSYLQQMIALNREVNGDAKELLAQLENKAIPRYRTDKIDELRDYLIDTNHLDIKESLSFETIFQEIDGFVANKEFICRGILSSDDLIKIKSRLKAPS